MASSNGIMNNNLIVNTIDGLTTIYASSIYDNGTLINPTGYVPYTGATSTLDMGTNAIRTSYTAQSSFDVVNKGLLDYDLANLAILVGNNFISSTQVTAQSMLSKLSLPTLAVTGITANSIIFNDTSKNLISSSVPTSYLTNLTSDPQTQINSKASITYVDTQDALRVPYTGATSTVNLGTQKIQSSTAPTLTNDLTNKAYVDSAIAGITSSSILPTNNVFTGNNNFDGTLFQVINDSFYSIRNQQTLPASPWTAISGSLTSSGGIYTITGGPYGGACSLSYTFSTTATLYRFTISCSGSMGGSTLTITQNGLTLYSSSNFGPTPTYSTFSGYFRPPYGASYAVNWVFRSPAYGGSVSWQNFTLERVTTNVNAGLGLLTQETAPTLGTDVTNKAYVDSAVAGAGTSLLASNNTWSGFNYFNNNIQFNNYYIQRSTINYVKATDAGNWFKIATIANSSTGVFRVSWTGAGQHGMQHITAGVQYGSYPFIKVENSSYYSGAPIPTAYRISIYNADVTYGTHYIEMRLLDTWYTGIANIDIVVDYIDKSNQSYITVLQTKAAGTTTGYTYYQVNGYAPMEHNFAGSIFSFTVGQLTITNGSGNGYASITASGGSTRTGYINFYNGDTSRMGYIGYGDTSDFLFNVEQSRNLRFYTGAVDRMKIAANGTVAITNSSTTFSPSASCKLYVHDSATSYWAGMSYFGGNSNGIVAGQYSGDAWLGAHNAALNAWSDTYLCPGGNLFLPNVPQTPYSAVNSSNVNLLIRTPAGRVDKGALHFESVRNNSTAWSGGVSYSSILVTKASVATTVVITGHVSLYTSSVSSINVMLRLNPVGTSNYYYFYTNWFSNITYSHTNIPINWVLNSGDLPFAGDYYLFLGTTSPNVITDTNDVVFLQFMMIG